jgi:hypothetical protein
VPGLNGFVVDFDGGEIGQLVRQTFQRYSGAYDQMTWEVRTDFASREEVAEAVVENQAWAAVVINSGATANLSRAVALVDTSYNGSQAVYVYTNGARNQYATQYIMPAVRGSRQRPDAAYPLAQYTNPLMMVQQMFSSQNAMQLAGNPNLAAILTTAPQIATTPMSFLNFDLRPFDVPVATAIVFVGLIYVCIFAFVRRLVVH